MPRRKPVDPPPRASASEGAESPAPSEEAEGVAVIDEEAATITEDIAPPAASSPVECPQASLPPRQRTTCPWQRGRRADNTQVYRCARCELEIIRQ